MNIIIKEKDEQEKIAAAKAFLFIVAFIFAVNIIVTVLNRMKPLAAGISGIILIIVVAWVAYMVMDKKVTEYNYVLTDKGVIFEKVLGTREKAVMDIPFAHIDHVIPQEQAKEYDKCYYFLCGRKTGDKYILGYRSKGKTIGVVFRPSEKMVEGITERASRAR